MKCGCNECPNRPGPPAVFNGIFGALGVCVCKAPYVNTETGTWWEYDPSARAFVDTGVLANGAGAYELAVQYGYTGTEEEFAEMLLSIDNKVDKVEGKGLSTNDYTDEAKAKVDAIPSNPKYTDTVYDDTALAARISTIEAKESGWDGKYSKPVGGIPASDIAEGVIPAAPSAMGGATSSAAGSAGLVPAPNAGDQNKFLRGDGTWASAPAGGGSGSSTTLPVVDEQDNDTIVQGTLTATDDGGLTLTIERGVTPTLTLDSVAWEDKTYRDIFITANLSPVTDFENGQFTSDSQAVIEIPTNAITPTVTNEQSATGDYSLKASGSGSYQIRAANIAVTGGHTYYLACMVYCTSYTAGKLGFILSQLSYFAGISATNSGFTKASYQVAIPSNWTTASLVIGSMSSADLVGYVDDIVLIDKSIFTTQPTQSQLDALYEAYIGILNSTGSTPSETETVVFDLLGYAEGAALPSYTDAECRAAFVEEMNKRAALIGMSNATFLNASGYFIQSGNSYSYNTASATDMLRLLIHASGIAPLAKVWNKDSRAISVIGDNARTVNIDTTVTDNTLEASYHIFGGKTGSIVTGLQTGRYNVMAVTSAPDGNWFAAVIIGASTSANRWVALKQLLDIATEVYNDPNYDTSGSAVSATYAAVCLMPKHDPLSYDQYLPTLLYSKAATTADYPASMSKVLSSVILCEWIPDLHERLTFKASDLTGGSGPTFYAGDSITYEDALYAMMLPSSNSTAEAVARVVGEQILRSRNGTKALTPTLYAAVQAAIAALPVYDGTVS